jgi:nicotinamide mononucleotide (NMN) deamidase PncC
VPLYARVQLDGLTGVSQETINRIQTAIEKAIAEVAFEFETVANGTVAVSLGSTGPKGVNATPKRWIQFKDARGTLITIPSWT